MAFVRVESEWWEAIVMDHPRPWPKEFAMLDLRFWDNEQRRPAGKPFPGRRLLSKRWGWTDWAVRKLLRDEAWRDPYHDATTSPPAPPPSPPRHERANADNGTDSSQRHHDPTTKPPSRAFSEQENKRNSHEARAPEQTGNRIESQNQHDRGRGHAPSPGQCGSAAQAFITATAAEYDDEAAQAAVDAF